MPERFSPAQPNYLRFVSTPTIDIEPKFHAPLPSLLDWAGAFCAIDGKNFRKGIAKSEIGIAAAWGIR